MYESFSSRVDSGFVADRSRDSARNEASLRRGPQWSSFDFEYVQRLKDGDPETEQHFTAYFGELLLIKLRSRLRHTQTIEDIRQETFLRVLSTLKTKNSLHSPQSLGAFVNSVANNLLFELYRNQSRQRTVEQDEQQFDVPDHHASAEAQMLTDERRRQVQRILDELPARDRDLLRMTFCEERDQDEICQTLHAGRKYLRVLLHRAKARFRECLRKEYALEGQKGA
jgi:RNA polymerase sigma-70 factor (ECF subfamily)